MGFDYGSLWDEPRKRNVKGKTRKELMYKKKNCQYCRKNEVMHLHHIRYVVKGGSDRKSNLIGLCANCHYKVHHGLITTNQLKRRLGIPIKPKKISRIKKKRKSRDDGYFLHAGEAWGV